MKGTNFSNAFFILFAACALIFAAGTVNARAQKSNLVVKDAKVGHFVTEIDPTNIHRQNSSAITVTIANNARKDLRGAGEQLVKIKVTVYALPTKWHYFGDSTQIFQFTENVKNGTITEASLPLSPSFNNLDSAKQWIPAAWAKSSQEISVAPQSSKDFVFSLPSAYNVVPSPTGNDFDDKINSLYKIFNAKEPSSGGIRYVGVPPPLLTFNQSSFLIVVGNHAVKADKSSSGEEVMDSPDDAYFLNPTAKKMKNTI